MSSYQEFADSASRILEHKGDVLGQAAANKGALWGNTISTLGQQIPAQVQQVMKQAAAKRTQAQIQQIFADQSSDMPTKIQKVYALDPEMGSKLGKEYGEAQKTSYELAKMKHDYESQKLNYALNKLGSASDESSWASGILGLKEAGEDVSSLPLHFSPDAVKSVNMQLMTAKDRLAQTAPKAPEDYTLVPGSKRFSAENQMVAENPYQLTPDQQADNERLAASSKASEAERAATNERLTAGQAETVRHNRAMEGRQAATAGAQAADITKLTAAGLDVAALNYKKTGVMPPLGMGDRSTRQQIINRAAALTPADVARIEAGGLDLAGNKADYHADSTSLTALTKQRDAITAFENTAKKNIDLFLDTAKKVTDTGIPLLNTPARWIAGAGGSADMAKYNAARQVAISEIAKIVQNPNLTGQLSDSARHEIEVFNPSNATLRQTVAVMNLLKQDMANRKQSLDDQLKQTRGRIGGGTTQQADPLGIR